MGREVVLMGSGSLAVRIADWFQRSPDHELRWLVPTVPEPTWTDSLIGWAEVTGVPHVASGDYRELSGFADGSVPLDLVLSVFYDKIIRADFIDSCRRILNLHNGPLPRYRGVSPINWALKNGERQHGVTIHEITPGIDDGPIISRVDYSIYPEFDEVEDVYARALDYGFTLFVQTMPLLDWITARPQDESQATYYSREQNALLEERRDFTRARSLAGR